MRFWRTCILAAVAAALGLYIYLIERPRVAEEAAPDLVVAFEPADISKINLRYPDSTAITLERDGKSWHLRAPLDFPADSEVVERLLRQIADTKAERRVSIDKAEPLATYGLEADGQQARVTLVTADGTVLPDLVVGRTTPVGFSAFARVEGRDEILLTPLLLHTGVKKSVLELRKKSLFEIDPTQVIGIRMMDRTREVALERRGDDWVLSKPIEARGDRDQIQAILTALNELRALEFYDAPPEGGDGTDVATMTFDAELSGGGSVGFRLGRAIEDTPRGYYLRRTSDGLVVKVDEASTMGFDKDASALRDKHLFRCDASEASEIRIERADGASFMLTRAGDSWAVDPMPADSRVRDNVAQRTVTNLTTLAGQDVAAESAVTPESLAAFGLDMPSIDVEILRSDGASCGRALGATRDPESTAPAYYVKRADQDVVFTLPAYLFSRIDVRRDDLLQAPTPPPSDGGAAE